MCGFAGIYSFQQSSKVSRQVVETMTASLAHRGPDGSGVWFDKNQIIGLGHRRLAIQDLSDAGSQPMLSHANRFVIVFNGEIYNHLSLRKMLPINRWRGHSDTETFLQCVENWGLVTTLKRSSGMFSFALWDNLEHRLYLGRDRFGEKPLFYSIIEDGINKKVAFASEIKALKHVPGISRGIDEDALVLFFQYAYVTNGRTIYSGINKLEPGTILEFNERQSTGKKTIYWDVEDEFADAVRRCDRQYSVDDTLERLDNQLKTVVSEQMLADVSIGAFLSGGIDSSIIVALMQRNSSRKIKTFTVGYSESGYSEMEHAESVAKYLGTDHHSINVDAKMVLAALQKMPQVYDEPFADPSQIPTLILSKEIGNHVKVALTGDGGDELFAGYNRYKLVETHWRYLKNVPPPILHFLGKSIRFFPEHFWNKILKNLPVTSVGYKMHKFARVLNSVSHRRLYSEIVTCWSSDKKLLRFNSNISGVEKEYKFRHSFNNVQEMMLLDVMTYLRDDILVKVDRASMNCSLETRAPFLDNRIASLAWGIPTNENICNQRTKMMLRKLLYRYVPQEIVDRPKMGFGFPIDLWLRTELRDWVENLLSPEKIERVGFLNPIPIKEAWQQHLSGQLNWANQLWALLMFLAWYDQENGK